MVQKLTQMVGKNVKLYDMVLQFLRTLFLRTRNVHYCTLRAELLMSLHDLDVGDICSVDPCHKVRRPSLRRLPRWLPVLAPGLRLPHLPPPLDRLVEVEGGVALAMSPTCHSITPSAAGAPSGCPCCLRASRAGPPLWPQAALDLALQRPGPLGCCEPRWCHSEA